jgi:peptide methionine sulfoxide reductase MsrA
LLDEICTFVVPTARAELRANFVLLCLVSMQKWFKKTFPKGLSDVKVGYLGGSLDAPSYKVRFSKMSLCRALTGV